MFTRDDALQIGGEIGCDWLKYSPDQFCVGLNIELEHGTVDQNTNITDDDPVMTGKIVLAHLNEIPDYYYRLEEMEREANEVE